MNNFLWQISGTEYLTWLGIANQQWEYRYGGSNVYNIYLFIASECIQPLINPQFTVLLLIWFHLIYFIFIYFIFIFYLLSYSFMHLFIDYFMHLFLCTWFPQLLCICTRTVKAYSILLLIFRYTEHLTSS